MATIKELWEEKKAKRKREKNGPPENRPWGTVQRKAWAREHDLDAPGPDYALHHQFKNRAARFKFKETVDRYIATGVVGDALEIACKTVMEQFCKPVPIFRGLNARVRRQWRSEQARSERIERKTERDSGDVAGPPSDRVTCNLTRIPSILDD